MRRSFLRLVLGMPLVLSSSAKTKTKAKKATAASVEKILIQMEREWARAGMDQDAKTVDRIVADDWLSIDTQGRTTTKRQAIAALRSGSAATRSIELSEIKVRVFGTTAIVTGTDVEKSSYQGKDTSGRYAWMDVFLKREGRWQAVASQATKLD